jgi:ubiquinone/menaquinone biosynthesis C-methylase UbiE
MSRPFRFSVAFALACSSAPPPPANTASSHQGFHKDFSEAEAFSAHFDDPARDAWQRPEEVLDLMRIPPGSVVADLGAGTGYFASRLARRVGAGGQVLALDVEPKMIEFLEQRIERDNLANVRAVLVAPDDPGLAAGSVSRVLIVNTWHHIGARPSYAEKLRSGLAPDGEVWVVDFTPESDLGPPAQHRLSAEQVTAELQQAGLRAAPVAESLPNQYIVRAVR